MDEDKIKLPPEIEKLMGEMMADIQYNRAPAKMKFPDGLRYCYYGKFELFTGIWAFCYTTTRNENKKFASYVYMPVVGKRRWKMARILEHRLMKDAKARALRMYEQHRPVQEKYEALLKKRKGGKR